MPGTSLPIDKGTTIPRRPLENPTLFFMKEGRAIVLDQMKVAAKVAFVDDVVKVNTIEGYTALINFEDKAITIINETDSE